MRWDNDHEMLIITGTNAAQALLVDDGNVAIVDDLDVDGTTNLDVVDIDGAVQIDEVVTIGTDGSGQDVLFHSGTSDDYMRWDASAEALLITGTAAATALLVDDGNVAIIDDLDVGGTTNLDDVDIDLSTSMNIDGHMLDVGTGSCSVAAGDNDACIAGVLEVDGELELDGALDADSTANIAGALTLGAAFYPSFTDLTILAGPTYITPTYMIYALDSGEAVSLTLQATGTDGQLLILIGDDANNITINDTNLRSNDGNEQVLAQYGVLMLVYQDSEWLEISESNNS